MIVDAKDLFKLEASHGYYKALCDVSSEDTHAMWKWYVALSEVPRPSYHTEKATAWLEEAAKLLGCEFKKDDVGNCVLKCGATKGKENVGGVIFQGHSDMVATPNPHPSHNWETDPIKLIVDVPNDKLTADGTTLGADDGSGVAAGLAYLELRDTFEHPAMELLVTVDEEVGLLGACALKPHDLLSDNMKYLINIDSEDWGEVTVSSAGCALRKLTLPLNKEAVPEGSAAIKLVLSKFNGGHSGVQIECGMANAIIVAKDMIEGCCDTVRLGMFNGGHAHNAIPSTAEAIIVVPAEKKEAAKKALADRFALFQKLFPNEKKAECAITDGELTADVYTRNGSLNLFSAVTQMPHGVFKYIPGLDGKVMTSQNLATCATKGEAVEMQVFARSNDDSIMKLQGEFLDIFAKLHGGESVNPIEDVGGWPADLSSPLLQITKDCFKNIAGHDCEVCAIHAGLENSVVMQKYDYLGLQSISIGPTIADPHTPEESMVISTANKSYQLVRDIVAKLANQ